uniref:Pecanex-like protein n=1 Tax=Panagrellus redivivus TaxID=6233 RepID=A0A7E4WCJ8_PANRE
MVATSDSECTSTAGSGSESPPPMANRFHVPKEVEAHVHAGAVPLQTWSMFPISNSKVLIAVMFIASYAILFLYSAQRSTVVLIVMTGIIAVLIVSIYTSGVLCVLIMLLKPYKPDTRDLEGTPFDKFSRRISVTAAQQPNTLEIKF